MCCLGKCLYIKKKKKQLRVINYHQSLKLPTGAIKLRVNLPGFPWINQELSQGQAGLGRRDWQSSTSPETVGHNSVAHRWRSLGRAPSASVRQPSVQKTRPNPTSAQGFCLSTAGPPLPGDQDKGLWSQSRGIFSPDLTVNVHLSLFI